MQNYKSIITMVYYFIQLVHCMACIIMYLYKMIMSVLQEVKGLTKRLHFIILPVGRPVSMQNSGFTRFTCFDIGMHYNVLSGLIIISFSRSKRVNGKIICVCTSSDENLFESKIQIPNCCGY